MKRYDQCDETCTTDCGHCKGAGGPREWYVTHTVTQTVTAETAEEAERFARAALESDALWWPSVPDEGQVSPA